MNIKFPILLTLSLFPLTSLAAQSIYCPQNEGYIKVGMTEAEVLAACGQPLSKRNPNRPVTERVPVKQLIYTNLNKGSVYSTLNPIYHQWSLPTGSTGINLEVDIIHNKVSSVRINGSSTNAMSLCGGNSITVGDEESEVYNACGNPDMVNHTFMNQILPGHEKPAVWVYQVNPYQPPISLTFANGKLQSID